MSTTDYERGGLEGSIDDTSYDNCWDVCASMHRDQANSFASLSSPAEDPASAFMKGIKEACNKVEVKVPEGIAMRDSGKAPQLKLGGSTAQKLLPTALKYSLTVSGSLDDLQAKVKEMEQGCRAGFQFENPSHRALIVDYQCMVLERKRSLASPVFWRCYPLLRLQFSCSTSRLREVSASCWRAWPGLGLDSG